MEKGRTADHLFLLNSIIDSYKQKKKKVYAAFIDLKKGLWFSLEDRTILYKGSTQIFFNVIYSMYADTKSRINLSDEVSKSFLTKR